MPQGSAISPTLYTTYTADLPHETGGCINIQYADDVTQIITYPGKSRELTTRRTINEITKVNDYEKKWKIKTNRNKLKLVPIGLW